MRYELVDTHTHTYIHRNTHTYTYKHLYLQIVARMKLISGAIERIEFASLMKYFQPVGIYLLNLKISKWFVLCMWMYVYNNVCKVCKDIWICMWVCLCMWLYLYIVCMCVCVYVCMYICVECNRVKYIASRSLHNFLKFQFFFFFKTEMNQKILLNVR